MKRYLYILVLLVAFLPAHAAHIDTLAVTSSRMHRDIRCIVLSPDAAQDTPEKRFPTVFLLHGWGGDGTTWLKCFPTLSAECDTREVIFVAPDAESSWYLDSPLKEDSCFETFVAEELTAYIDKHYPTIPLRTARAVTGYSMGGHGAFYLAFGHPKVFGAAGSMSGGVHLPPFPHKWDLDDVLGDPATHADLWEKHSVVNRVEDLPMDGVTPLPALYFDCGEQDFFFDANCMLDQRLTERGIPHRFETRTGEHNYDFWRVSLRLHMDFFAEYFAKHYMSE